METRQNTQRVNSTMAHPNARQNADGSVNLPWGYAVEKHIMNLPLLQQGAQLKHQTRHKVREAMKDGLVILERSEEAIDYLSWTTRDGKTKETNRLDDRLRLTDAGREHVAK